MLLNKINALKKKMLVSILASSFLNFKLKGTLNLKYCIIDHNKNKEGDVMRIKRSLMLLSAIGFVGLSSYATAETAVYRFPAQGVKMSTGVSEGVGDEVSENKLSAPSNLVFNESNEQLSGNTGNSGSVTVYDEFGNSVGSGFSNEVGDFTIAFNPSLDAGGNLTIEVTDGIDTFTSTVIVPELETDVACYDPTNIGKIGTYQGCEGMLIVNLSMLMNASSVGSNYSISFEGVDYSFNDSEHNVFTGQLTSLDKLFYNRTDFNGDIGYWDVTNVRSMNQAFFNAESFNQDISSWKPINLINTRATFGDAELFNSYIGHWNMSNVTDMAQMFYNAKSFNQDIGNWDISSATSLNGMFYNTQYFNHDISGWNTSNIIDMTNVFNGAYSFNQDISGWDTSNVIDRNRMTSMFKNAQSFNQDLSNWCVANITSLPYYFDNGASSWTLPKPEWGTCP